MRKIVIMRIADWLPYPPPLYINIGFGLIESKINLSFNGINYTDHPNTISEHFRSQLGNINNKVFIVGGGYASTVNKQTEAGFINFVIFMILSK